MRNKYFIQTILLILKVYAASITVFFIFRLLLFLTELHRLEFTAETTANIIKAFLMGVRFDIVITGYLMILPSLLLLTSAILNRKNLMFIKIIFYFLLISFSLAFAVCAADIPYFNQFFKRFDTGAFEWLDSPLFVFGMIVEEPRYILAVVPFIAAITLFYKYLKNIFKQYEKTKISPKNSGLFPEIIISVLVLLLIFAGIRGRLQKKSPIRTGTAYFCQDPFLNQLGLNPVFTLVKSFLHDINSDNKSIQLIRNDIAIKNVQSCLGITKEEDFSPVARKIEFDTAAAIKPNIILIIMESMSAAKMKRFGNEDNLTPFLDSLSYHSWFFTNIYTTGKHTFNGIFSTLFSFPAIYKQHPLKRIKRFPGISHTLKQKGYTTTYFTTHDGQFDNVEGFLYANDFDNVISQKDYPSKEVKTTLGVPDDYMFRYSIPEINALHRSGKPFFVTFMTASDHGPYYVPEYFHPHSKNIKKQIVEYADWSLQQFISPASQTDWFDNTIFVFIADHGAAIDVRYPVALNYHHTPLLFYAPKIIKPREFDCTGSQMDVFPTLMGILKQPYINNTLGVDLIREKRPYAILNADDKTAALDNEFLFVLENDKKMLFRYKNNDRTNHIRDYPSKAKEMETCLKSNLQVFQYMLNHEHTLFQPKR